MRIFLFLFMAGAICADEGWVSTGFVGNDPLLALYSGNFLIKTYLDDLTKVVDNKQRVEICDKMELMARSIEATANRIELMHANEKADSPEVVRVIFTKFIDRFKKQELAKNIAFAVNDITKPPENRYQKLANIVDLTLPNQADLILYRNSLATKPKMSDKPWPGNKAYDEEMRQKLRSPKSQDSSPN